MVEPVSLGVAAVALLGSKFGEGLAKDAGSSSWRAVIKLRDLIARRLGSQRETATAVAELERDPSPKNQAALAEAIEQAARADSSFATALRELVSVARADNTLDVFVANAYDQARQINIHGDNNGPITLS